MAVIPPVSLPNTLIYTACGHVSVSLKTMINLLVACKGLVAHSDTVTVAVSVKVYIVSTVTGRMALERILSVKQLHHWPNFKL